MSRTIFIYLINLLQNVYKNTLTIFQGYGILFIMKKQIALGRFGALERKVKALEKRLDIVKRQNTNIISKNVRVLSNQKHYLEKKAGRSKLADRYRNKLERLSSLYESLVKFLDQSTLPRPTKRLGRTIFVKLTKYEYWKLLSLLGSGGKITPLNRPGKASSPVLKAD